MLSAMNCAGSVDSHAYIHPAIQTVGRNGDMAWADEQQCATRRCTHSKEGQALCGAATTEHNDPNDAAALSTFVAEQQRGTDPVTTVTTEPRVIKAGA